MRKKTIVGIFIALAFFGSAAYAQTETQVAILKADGSQQITRTSPSGSVRTVTVASGETVAEKLPVLLATESNRTSSNSASASVGVGASTKPVFVRHEAVLRSDGTAEMHLTEASGKVTVLSAKAGESIQKTYWDYLTKEGIPCACGETLSTAQAPKIATRP